MPAFLPGYLLYSFNCHARRDRVVTLVEQTPDPNKHLEVVNGMIWIGKLPALEFITQPPCQAPPQLGHARYRGSRNPSISRLFGVTLKQTTHTGNVSPGIGDVNRETPAAPDARDVACSLQFMQVFSVRPVEKFPVQGA